jgi:hypothetical protein
MNPLFVLPLPQPLAAPRRIGVALPPSESDLIRARIASAARWRRRHRWLRLHAAIFGRAKHAARPCAPALRPALG